MGKLKFNKIKEVLDGKGLNQSWLADEIGISKNAMSNICTNKSQPKLETLYKIASKLEVGISQLLINANPFEEKKLVLNNIMNILSDKEIDSDLLSSKLNLSKDTVNDICSNDIQPTLRQLFKIANILNISPCELLADKNPFSV